jgi:hypothetical protein
MRTTDVGSWRDSEMMEKLNYRISKFVFMILIFVEWKVHNDDEHSTQFHISVHT